jgi:xanthine dehydrogenase small subunit
MINFILNTENISTELSLGMQLLDFIRCESKLTSTKEGCREGDCGACLVLVSELNKNNVSYKPVNSCLFPLGEANGKHIVTIEGVNLDELNLIQQAFVDEGAAQCGFCTPEFILSLTAYFLNALRIIEEEAISSVDGNICRCTGYLSVIRAIQSLCKVLGSRFNKRAQVGDDKGKLKLLVSLKILPDYFLKIPDRLNELLSYQKDETKKATMPSVIIAGGTDLFIQKPNELTNKSLIFLSQKEELKNIWIEKKSCFIGSMATVEDLKNSNIIQEAFPNINNFFKLISSTPIQYRATIGGNIINASPIGDLTIFFLALDALIVLNDGHNRRELSLKDFFKGYKQLDKKAEEMLEFISFKILPKNALFHFEKVSRRKHLDIASVNSAIQIHTKNGTIMNIHISAGGIAPIPYYLSKTTDFLLGKKINSEFVKEASLIAQAEISPISDVRGSKEYKRLLLRQLIYSHFIKLFPKEVDIGVLL